MYTQDKDISDPECVITAQDIVFQDIGTPGYTVYKPGADFVKIMMKRPDLLKMKWGHIHSHNSMSVFFSGTDVSELIDNAGNHNTYLSLIVNNKNEMTAKVAFQATRKNTINSVNTYRDSNGEVKEFVESMSNEDIKVYAYDCEITKPQMIDDTLLNAYNEVVERHNKQIDFSTKAQKLKEGLQSTSTFRQDEDWVQKRENKGWGKQASIFEGSFEDDDWEIPKDKKKKRTIANNVYSFMSKMFSGDVKSKKGLNEVLNYLDQKINSRSDVHKFGEIIDRTIDSYYVDSFPEDQYMVDFENTICDAIDLLDENFKEKFPTLVEDLTEILLVHSDSGLKQDSWVKL